MTLFYKKISIYPAKFPNDLFYYCTNSLSSLHISSLHCTFCASLQVKTSPALYSAHLYPTDQVKKGIKSDSLAKTPLASPGMPGRSVTSVLLKYSHQGSVAGSTPPPQYIWKMGPVSFLLHSISPVALFRIFSRARSRSPM